MLNRNKRCSIKNLICFMMILLTAMIFFPLNGYCAEEEASSPESVEQSVIDAQAESGEARSIEEQVRKFSGGEFNEIIQDFDPQDMIKDAAKGNFKMDVPGLLNRAVQYIFKEIYLNIHILIKLIVLVVLCALLKNLQSAFLSESVGELAFYVCYIVVVSIIILSFNTALNMGVGIIDSMVGFMYGTIPVLITLLVSGGNITSGGIFQPVMLMIVEVVATLIKNVFIPLIFLSTVLSIINNISDKVHLSKLAGMLKQITVWALGLILTVFIGIVSLQGSLGAVVDGVTGKTAKFALGAFIPIAGKYLADAAETVVACTLLIKNAAGLAVMIGIIAICLVPLLKILALISLYKLTTVLIEPIAEKRITGCINDVANSMTFLFGIVASVAVMFLITVTAIISAGNLSAMIR